MDDDGRDGFDDCYPYNDNAPTMANTLEGSTSGPSMLLWPKDLKLWRR